MNEASEYSGLDEESSLENTSSEAAQTPLPSDPLSKEKLSSTKTNDLEAYNEHLDATKAFPVSSEYERNRISRSHKRTHRRKMIALVSAVSIIVLGVTLTALYMYWDVIVAKTSSVEYPLTTTTVTRSESVDSLATLTSRITHCQMPLIATYDDIKLRLPVYDFDLTEIGFHQASYTYALPLQTPLADADNAQCRNKIGTGHATAQPHGANAVFDGRILRMWRLGGQGEPNTSIDAGASPGKEVLSPVDGTVVLVKAYKLYEKWNDYEIHIQPPGRPDLDVVLIHVQDPAVKAGDNVEGGVTEVGQVRRLDDKEPMQLRHYTPVGDEGDHVHVQVNNTKDPLYVKMKKLEGAISVP